jgi:hypothetical protein
MAVFVFLCSIHSAWLSAIVLLVCGMGIRRVFL